MSYLAAVLVIAGSVCFIKGKKLTGLILVAAGTVLAWGTVLTKS